MATVLSRLASVACTTTLVLAALVIPSSPALAAPPAPPSLAQARTMLSGLTVKAEGASSAYDRSLFPHWSTVEGNCNTREWVLRRDGTNVTVGNDCYPTSGSWYSVYDGVTTSVPSQISIDHFVPLAEAWRSGADTWSTSRRQQFANDLTTGQLWAVTGTSNSSKGDKDPAKWMPTRTAVHCDYAKTWIHVKDYWNLSVDSAEKTKLTSLLNSSC
ncbi:HNH endonuclease family protein [Nocardiopsis ansamitocini]|uniref:GmrSD restriction endonucleases C-terminal domain-containing protein n=1 Tax=Nocardiopsis ansamitocini TaxID=1670832 RepID=A0A9W6UGV8_9ACTN|nr:HNH endonuclease family protein [Nocardiopsis ansamitocini]GLU48151.1 hypothetical protein Nans01_25020 [Nocardiopsis ansamitocini]